MDPNAKNPQNPISSHTQVPPPPVNPLALPPQYEEVLPENRFNRSFFIKLGIALFVFVAFIIVVFFVIVPLFRGGSGKVTLVYWGVWEDEAVFSGVFSEFERLNPNIDVKYEKQDIKTLKKYVERLATRAEAGTGPDIFRYHNSWLFMIKNLLLPFPADVVSTVELDTKYYPVIKNDLNRNGAYYGLPLGYDNLALFINDSIFKSAGISPPKTWDEFITVARQLTVKDEFGSITTSGAAMGTFDNVDHASDIVSLLFVQNGADLKDLGGKNTQNAADALAFYGSFARSESEVWNSSLTSSKLAFSQGRLAMYFGYSWDIFEIQNVNPDFGFSIHPVPHVSGVNPDRNITIASYWVEGVSVRSKHAKEAFELMKFLGQKDTLEKLYNAQRKVRSFGEPYPRSDMQVLLSDNAILLPFVKQGSNAVGTIFSSDTYDDSAITVLNGYLGNAVRAQAADGSSSQTAIKTLSQGVAEVLSKYE